MYKSATLKVIVFPSLSYTVHILSLEKLRTLETQSHVQEQRYSLFGGLGSSLHIYWYIGSKKILYTMFLKHMAHMFQAFASKRELHLQWFLVSFKALPSTTTAFQHTDIYIYIKIQPTQSPFTYPSKHTMTPFLEMVSLHLTSLHTHCSSRVTSKASGGPEINPVFLSAIGQLSRKRSSESEI